MSKLPLSSKAFSFHDLFWGHFGYVPKLNPK